MKHCEKCDRYSRGMHFCVDRKCKCHASTTDWREEFDTIGFGNQAKIHGFKRFELVAFIEKAVAAAWLAGMDEILHEANRCISTPGWSPTRGDVYRALLEIKSKAMKQYDAGK